MNKHVTAAQISRSPTDGTGEFEAVVYDPRAGDVDGVIITARGMQSAVDTFHKRGRNLVLRWNHDMSDPAAALGVITDLAVENGVLVVRGKLDLNHEKAVSIYEAMLSGRINEFSIGWTVPEGGYTKRGDLIYVDVLEIPEVSVVAAGANRGTQLVSVKNVNGTTDGVVVTINNPAPKDFVVPLNVKAGRTISAKNEASLRASLASIQASVRDLEDTLTALTASETPEPEIVVEEVKTLERDRLRQALTLLVSDVV